MLPLIIGGAIALIGSLASSIGAAESAKKAEQQQRARRDKAERRYQHEVNKDFLETDTAKSTLAAIRKQGDKQLEALGNNAVKSGASDEAKVAAASQVNESYADAASRIAGYGTQYKQQLEDRYLQRLDQFDDSLIGIEQSKANAWNGLGDSVAALGSSVATAYGQGAFSKAPAATTTADTTSASTTTAPNAAPSATPPTQSQSTPTLPRNAEQIARSWDPYKAQDEKAHKSLFGWNPYAMTSFNNRMVATDYDLSMKNLLW